MIQSLELAIMLALSQPCIGISSIETMRSLREITEWPSSYLELKD
jgi:hypothetical protein